MNQESSICHMWLKLGYFVDSFTPLDLTNGIPVWIAFLTWTSSNDPNTHFFMWKIYFQKVDIILVWGNTFSFGHYATHNFVVGNLLHTFFLPWRIFLIKVRSLCKTKHEERNNFVFHKKSAIWPPSPRNCHLITILHKMTLCDPVWPRRLDCHIAWPPYDHGLFDESLKKDQPHTLGKIFNHILNSPTQSQPNFIMWSTEHSERKNRNWKKVKNKEENISTKTSDNEWK